MSWETVDSKRTDKNTCDGFCADMPVIRMVTWAVGVHVV